jgi:hypothetical protein
MRNGFERRGAVNLTARNAAGPLNEIMDNEQTARMEPM